MKKSMLLAVIGFAFITQGCGLLKKDDRSPSNPVVESLPATSENADGIVGETTAEKDTAAAGSVELDGKGLYGKLCAACHSALEQTDINKASLAAIQKAILEETDMNGLKDVPEKDLIAISSVITPGKGKGKEVED